MQTSRRTGDLEMNRGKGDIIVTTGRGGTGKTTFVALMSKFFKEIGVESLLLIDTDPDQSLAEMVGVNLKEDGKETVSEEIYRIREERLMQKTSGRTVADKIEPFLFEKSIYEGPFFSLSAIGTKWDEGCYCVPNRALGRIIQRWSKNYEYVLIDSPAGLEHLNRRITNEVKDIFNVIGPSKKALDNATRAYKIINELDLSFQNYYLVGGYRFRPELEEGIEEATDLAYVGRMAFDKEVEEYCLQGRSLLELPESSPAYQSVKQIMEKVGYRERPLTLSRILKTD